MGVGTAQPAAAGDPDEAAEAPAGQSAWLTDAARCSWRATATASIRECTPSAWRMCRMWLRTVSLLRCSSAAICSVRPAVLEQPKDLGLARREIVDGRNRLLTGLVLEVAEHADDPAPEQTNECTSTSVRCPRRRRRRHPRPWSSPSRSPSWRTRAARGSSPRCDDRRELLAPRRPRALRRQVHPADDPSRRGRSSGR